MEGGGAPQSPPAGDLGSCLEEAEKSNQGAGARNSAGPGGRAPEPPPPRHPGCDPARRPGQRAPRTGLETARAPGSFPRRHLVKGRGCHPPLPQRILHVPGSEAARRNESLALRARGGLEAPGPARPGTTGTRPDGGLPGAASPGSSEATHGPARRSDAPELQQRRCLLAPSSHSGRRGTPSAARRAAAPAGLRLRLSVPPSFLLLLQSRRARVPRTSSSSSLSSSSFSSSSSLGLLPSDRPGSSRTKTQTLGLRRRNCFRRLRHVAARSEERRDVTSTAAPPRLPKRRSLNHVTPPPPT